MTQHDAHTGHSAHEGHEVIQETGAGAVRELLTWYRPNFAGMRGLMSWVALGTVILPSLGFFLTVTSESIATWMTQSARFDCRDRSASSGVFSATSVAFGSTRRAKRSCDDPMSTATRTSRLRSPV